MYLMSDLEMREMREPMYSDIVAEIAREASGKNSDEQSIGEVSVRCGRAEVGEDVVVVVVVVEVK